MPLIDYFYDMKRILLFLSLLPLFASAQIPAIKDTTLITPSTPFTPQFRFSNVTLSGVNYRMPQVFNSILGKYDTYVTTKYLRAFYGGSVNHNGSITADNRIALWNGNDSLTVLPTSYFTYNLAGNFFRSFNNWNFLGSETNIGNAHILTAPTAGDQPIRLQDSTKYVTRGRLKSGTDTIYNKTYVTPNFLGNPIAQKNGASFMEFHRTDGPALYKAAIGQMGSDEVNVSSNMDYTTSVHRLYDNTRGAQWLALNENAYAIQYSKATTVSGDVWNATGGRYLIRGDSLGRFALNTFVGDNFGDAQLYITKRGVSGIVSDIGGNGDLLISGDRRSVLAAPIYLNYTNAGNVYIAGGGGKTSIGGTYNARLLNIQGGTDPDMVIKSSVPSGGAGSSGFYFGNSTTDFMGAIVADHSNLSTSIYNNGGLALSFNSSRVANFANPFALPNGSTATTQSVKDSTDKVATDKYVDRAVAASIASTPAYSEGSWTPTGTTALTSPTGRYTKIGNMVYASFDLVVGTNVSSGVFSISGLPFTNSANSKGSVIINSQTAQAVVFTGFLQSGTTNVYFKNQNTSMTDANFSGAQVSGTIIYSTTN